MDKIRSFLAVDFNAFYEEELDSLIRILKKEYADGKWTRSKAAHLTLNFFGEIDQKSVDGIIRALEPMTETRLTFEVVLQGVGAFPSFARPRVLWAGLAGDVRDLLELKQEIDVCLEKIGIPPETRPFHPHLTLGRVPSAVKRNICLADQILNYASLKKFKVNRLVLFRSDLGREGPRYTALHDFKFVVPSSSLL